MNRLTIAVVVVLLVSATTTVFSSQQASLTVGIDANIDGNEAAQLGPTDTCRSVEPGDVFEIDVIAKAIPPVQGAGVPGGLLGFSYNLLFEPGVLQVNALDNELLIAEDGGAAPFEVIDADFTAPETRQALPATTGNLRIDYVDLNAAFESGDGVLSRLTVEAVGAGQSPLRLIDEVGGIDYPTLLSSASRAMEVGEVGSALITVGELCEGAPTPQVLSTSTPGAGGSPEATPTTSDGGPAGGAGASSAPVGDTELAVDVVPEDNSADKVGAIQACAGAELQQTFVVDVIINDVNELLAWEAPISYDPNVLQIVDRDSEHFLAATDGSQILDTSQRVPDSTGRFTTGAVDTGDPPTPESGSGVLVRLTMMAVGEGTSEISIQGFDIGGGEEIDRGVLLRNVDGEIIGDEDGDTFFDGPKADAEIRVGDDCPDRNARVQQVNAQAGTDDSDGDSAVWIIVVLAVAALLIAAGLGYFFMRRRRAASV